MPLSRSNFVTALFAVATSATAVFSSAATSAYASGGPSPPSRFHNRKVVAIDWSQLGSAGTVVSLPRSVFPGENPPPCCLPPGLMPGLPVVFSSDATTADVINSASYPSGQALLWVHGSDIELTFPQPLWGGIEAYVQTYNGEPFTAQMTLYFTGNYSASFDFPGFPPNGLYWPYGSPVPFGWAPSIGNPYPYSVIGMDIDITSPLVDTGGLVIGTVYTTVPELATWAAMLVGFAGLRLAFMLRARRLLSCAQIPRWSRRDKNIDVPRQAV